MRNERRMSGSGRGGERPVAERWHGARRLLSPPRWSRAAARHDDRAARVHPPLPAPCPATRLSPHPPLRLARQFSTQGQYCPRPRAACRRAAAGACGTARATRSSPALSLLRRAHVHHRDLRAMEAIPRATPRARSNRECPLVTRHGLRSSHAATPLLRRMRQYTLFATISPTGLNMRRGQLPIHAPPGDKSHSTSPRRLQLTAGFAVTTAEQNFKSP